MTLPVDVIVAVPAHDEQRRIEACLGSVMAAVHRAREEGLVARATVGVATHRCSDATGPRAARVLRRHPELDGGVHENQTADTVGEVRHTLIGALAERWARSAHRTWVFNTDADSVVPTDWVASTVAQASSERAAAVAGLVQLVDWNATVPARREYERLVQAGIRGDGHTHVYAANLAVRFDGYLAVQGFPAVPHGEDQALVGRLREGGWRVRTSARPLVHTSGRMPGRAAQGLGALLHDLVNRPLMHPGAPEQHSVAVPP